MMRYTIVRERVNLVRTTTRRDFIGVVSRMSYTEGRAVKAGGEAGQGGECIMMAAKLVVLAETFDGTKNWDEWYFHFENIPAVNGWDD